MRKFHGGGTVLSTTTVSGSREIVEMVRLAGAFEAISGIAGLLLSVRVMWSYPLPPSLLAYGALIAIPGASTVAGVLLVRLDRRGYIATLAAQGILLVGFVKNGLIYQVLLGPYFRLFVGNVAGIGIEWGASIGWRITHTPDPTITSLAINVVPITVCVVARRVLRLAPDRGSRGESPPAAPTD